MTYTVEVRLVGDGLSQFMSAMRSWLDSHRYEPATFRYSPGSPITTCRLDFIVEQEATAFAEAFDERVMGNPIGVLQSAGVPVD